LTLIDTTLIEESEKLLNGPIDDTIYKRDLGKRIELINWVLENMKNPDIQICNLIESKMNEIIDILNLKGLISYLLPNNTPPIHEVKVLVFTKIAK
jgi:hypothetical protein